MNGIAKTIFQKDFPLLSPPKSPPTGAVSYPPKLWPHLSLMKPPKVTCPCCKGSGLSDLPADLMKTYGILKKSKKPLTTAALEESGIGLTAINNRLTSLERLGLIKRSGKAVRSILWEAIRP